MMQQPSMQHVTATMQTGAVVRAGSSRQLSACGRSWLRRAPRRMTNGLHASSRRSSSRRSSLRLVHPAAVLHAGSCPAAQKQSVEHVCCNWSDAGVNFAPAQHVTPQLTWTTLLHVCFCTHHLLLLCCACECQDMARAEVEERAEVVALRAAKAVQNCDKEQHWPSKRVEAYPPGTFSPSPQVLKAVRRAYCKTKTPPLPTEGS